MTSRRGPPEPSRDSIAASATPMTSRRGPPEPSRDSIAASATPMARARLAATFGALRERGERALVAYLTAGDPSLADTRRLAVEAARRGADVIELGVPFSDPLADGPVIQRAGHRALAAGVTLGSVLDLAREIRADIATPLVLLTYYNPVLAYGLKAFATGASQAEVDGVIVADLPPEEAGPLATQTAASGLDLVHMVGPTSPPARLRLIARRSRGFVYVVSLTGVTGVREAVSPEVERQCRALRSITTLPICVGFGISSPEHVRAIGRYADGVIVGSAIVRLVEQHAGRPALVDEVGHFIAALKEPLRTSAA